MTTLIVWSDKYSVGCEKIDKQHKKLVDLINQLYNDYVQRKSKEEIAKVLKELVDYTVYHFNDEINMLEQFGYDKDKLEQHKEAHNYFVEKLNIFQKRYELGDEYMTLDLLNFLRDWLLSHILKIDQQYSESVCSQVD